MLRVVIVDDELLMRRGIRALVDWEEQGFSIVGEAANGTEALRVIRETKPDIVFTDIIMPEMGGLPLIREALKEFPQLKVVVLSCHNDYEYVREALTLGARDYILKLSMLPDDLTAVLQKLFHEIYGEKPVIQMQSAGKSETAEALRDVLYHSESGKESVIEQYFGDKSYAAVYIRLYFEAADKGGGQAVVKFLADNFFGKQDVLFKRDDTTLIALTTVDYEHLRAVYDRYASVLRSQFGLLLMAGMSGEKTPQVTVKRLFEQARDAYRQGFYEGYMVYPYRNRYFSHALAEQRTAAMIDEAGDFLAAYDYDSAEQVMRELWAEMEGSRLEPEEALVICFEVYLKYQQVLFQKINRSDFLLKKSGFQDSISALGTFREIQEHLLFIARNLIGNLNLFRETVLKDEVNRVVEYIGAQLGEDISLKSAAACVSLSESYLSHLFKREMGESFSDHLQKQRIERAKYLLAKTADSVNAVAAACGYEDCSYFCRVFKKVTGMTPREYRRGKR